MKVLQINAVNKIASTGRTTSEMADFLRQTGHTCAVAYSVGPSENPEFEYRIGSDLDAKLHGLLSRVSGKQGYFSKSATRKLLSFTDDFAPDIVVLRNLHANYIHEAEAMVLKNHWTKVKKVLNTYEPASLNAKSTFEVRQED